MVKTHLPGGLSILWALKGIVLGVYFQPYWVIIRGKPNKGGMMVKTSFNALVDNLNAGLNNFAGRFLLGPVGGGESDNSELLQAVAQAHREWELAEKVFETVTDPDLVDYAIYQVQAAQKRYTYLLRRAKEEGIKTKE